MSEMEAVCKKETNGAAYERVLFFMVESMVAEVVSTTGKTLLCLLLVMGCLSNESGILGQGDKLIKGNPVTSVGGSKGESVPENKDDGGSDDDDEDDNDDDGGDQDDDDGGEEDFSGEEGNDEGDEDEDDPEANGRGGSEEEDDDDEENEDDDDEDEDEEEAPPSKKRK